MILAFSEHINNKPTYFAEKIWAANVSSSNDCFKFHEARGNAPLPIILSKIAQSKPKKHTIRADKSNRWAAGRLIHPVYHCRTKDQYQFAPTMKCTGMQKIEIKIFDKKDGAINAGVKIDGRALSSEEVNELAVNDGFSKPLEFFEYFKEDFTGKIIHWTEKRY